MSDWEGLVEGHLLRLADVVSGVTGADTARFLDMLKSARKVFLVGRGRTGYIVGTFAMRLMHLGLDVHVVGDCTTPRISGRDLLVACSGSGRTRMVIHMAQITRRAGGRIVFLTYNPNSPPQDGDDLRILIPAAIDRDSSKGVELLSTYPLGTLFEESLLVYLDLVIARFMELHGIKGEDLAGRHTNLE